MSSATGARRDQRPEFMVILGLLPPLTLDDVKGAYREKIQTAHPDHGGSIAEFRRIQAAYEEAQGYVAFSSDKRAWIAAQIERYAAKERLEQQLRQLGAEVEHQEADWLQRSYGDFAQLTATIETVRLHDSPHGNSVIRLLVDNHTLSSSLKRLELVRCELTDDAVLGLSCLQLLEHLDLSHNRLSGRIVRLAAAIPNLSEFQTSGNLLGVWGRMRLARLLRHRANNAGSPG